MNNTYDILLDGKAYEILSCTKDNSGLGWINEIGGDTHFWVELINENGQYVSGRVSAKRLTFSLKAYRKLEQKLIYICSPLKGDIQGNIAKAREHSKTILSMGHMPLAPHVIFDKVLDDNVPHERETALRLGLELVKRCNELWIFDKVISEGMKAEIELAKIFDIPVKRHYLIWRVQNEN